jgi:hypothetical protein
LAKEKPDSREREQASETENMRKRLDMFDQRLDSLDTMVSAVIERVMNQPIVIAIACPHCDKNIEISLIGNQKPRG